MKALPDILMLIVSAHSFLSISVNAKSNEKRSFKVFTATPPLPPSSSLWLLPKREYNGQGRYQTGSSPTHRVVAAVVRY